MPPEVRFVPQLSCIQLVIKYLCCPFLLPWIFLLISEVRFHHFQYQNAVDCCSLLHVRMQQSAVVGRLAVVACCSVRKIAAVCGSLWLSATACSSERQCAAVCGSLRQTTVVCDRLPQVAKICGGMAQSALYWISLRQSAVACSTLRQSVVVCGRIR